MPKILSGKQVIKILCRKFGFYFVSQKGSHVKLKKREKGGEIVTIVPLHKELARGTLKGVLELAEIDEQKFCKNRGFTLIELLVVISIIGFLATASMVVFNNARMKARDARRLADMTQTRKALDLYYDSNNQYPPNTDNDYGGWDVGYYGSGDSFISSLETAQIIKKVPGDPFFTSQTSGYRYYRYPAGSDGCVTSQGAFYVLGVTDMETSGSPYPVSPGWSCPGRNWQSEFDWVTGKFEN